MIRDPKLAIIIRRVAEKHNVSAEDLARAYMILYDIVRDAMRAPTLPRIIVPGSGEFRPTVSRFREKMRKMKALERKMLLDVTTRENLDHYEKALVRINQEAAARREKRRIKLEQKYQDGDIE